MSPKDRLIVALDVPSRAAALALVERLAPHVGWFKIGKELFTAEGPALVRDVLATGAKVFLDLKFHDIPNTVASASVAALRMGVQMFNVHALGGGVMMRTTIERVRTVAEAEGLPLPIILAVTVLTSSDQATLDEIGLKGPLPEAVARLAKLARASGLGGVVCSPHEASFIREEIADPAWAIVTPGVRPAWAAANDQRRFLTPAEAVAVGASHLVIGRPITAHPDPVEAVRLILEELE